MFSQFLLRSLLFDSACCSIPRIIIFYFNSLFVFYQYCHWLSGFICIDQRTNIIHSSWIDVLLNTNLRRLAYIHSSGLRLLHSRHFASTNKFRILCFTDRKAPSNGLFHGLKRCHIASTSNRHSSSILVVVSVESSPSRVGNCLICRPFSSKLDKLNFNDT